MIERTSETWHVTLFHHHPDGSATQYAWWVDAHYAGQMLAFMGRPHVEGLMSAEDVQASIEVTSKVPMLTSDDDGEVAS